MKYINIEFLNKVVEPWAGLGDLDLSDHSISKYINLNPNNELAVKEIIKEDLKTYYERYDEVTKKKSKDALSYILTTDKCDFEMLFNSELPPFEAPSNAKDLYIWIWEILFPDEEYFRANFDEYEIINDSEEVYGKTSTSFFDKFKLWR